ncbi:uncharacterized protein LOC114527689 [Dendronephthya gigantea]|uniref:uncharacterized protein LOC114527689 n=1 Tax=Dendronephthya gigantea TaxID=151771 RepID=UPI00106B312A|nr:uncharacterized protein LOC114527689 [Dendronephthya gigantea]
MPWSEAQRNRLAAEKSVLDHFFPGSVKWIDPTGDTKVEINLKTNNDNEYTLRVYIGDFPNSIPDMVVISSPKPMPDWGFLAHTLGKRDGYLQICHYHPSQWTDRSSLYEVIMKGRVWLEAYEGHLRTGKPMSYFLREMGASESFPSSPESSSSLPNLTSRTESSIYSSCVCQ